MIGIRHLLPATAIEIAAECGCTVKQAHGRLHSLKRHKGAKPSDRKINNGNTGVGAHLSRLWVRT